MTRGVITFFRHLKWFSLALTGLGLCIALSSNWAQAETLVEITPIDVRGGGKMTWSQCPCFRWVAQLNLGGVAVETREFLITSDALIKMRREKIFNGQDM